MSQPHAAAPASKRPFSSTTTSPSPTSSPATPLMKKAKHPAATASSVGTVEKNGIHLDTAAAAATGGGRTNGEEDAEMVLVDQDELPAPSAPASAGVAANLFRKKATLPQPSTSARKPLRIRIGAPPIPYYANCLLCESCAIDRHRH
uniref:Uncharacterized protein n=1 Tax=Zea mays TaxID=4577 RepID=C4J396_MAIZE|nr:unknown [Zea mays]